MLKDFQTITHDILERVNFEDLDAANEILSKHHLCARQSDSGKIEILSIFGGSPIAFYTLKAVEKEKETKEPEEVDSTSDERTINNVMRHGYRVLTDEEKANMQKIKDMGLEFWELIDGIGNDRELSIAKTKIEEAVMWAVKSITR